MSVKPKIARCPIAIGGLLIALLIVPSAFATDARYEGISANGDVAFFSTSDNLIPGDTDTRRDVYSRAFDASVGGYVTREVSFGPTGGNNAFDAQYLGANDTGDKVFFSTAERLTVDDKDITTDIYVRDLTKNETTLVSAGDPSCPVAECGNAKSPVSAVGGGISTDGNRIFFATDERLSGADEDGAPDIYVRDVSAETTTLVSVGVGAAPVSFLGASSDGLKAIFTTPEPLLGADQDTEPDLYERNLQTSQTALVSEPGAPGACPTGLTCAPTNSTISRNGAHVFFESNERILLADTDSKQDVYDWSGGAASLASIAAGTGNGPHNALYERSSADGSAVFFSTDEPLVATDLDTAQKDIYVRSGGETDLVSEGDPSCAISNCGNGNESASLEWISATGSLAILRTAEPLTAEDEDEKPDIYTRALPAGPTTLVTRPGPTCTDPQCGNGAHDTGFSGASADGSHVFFVTGEALVPPDPAEPLAPGDSDSSTDVYERSGGVTKLVSVGLFNGNGPYAAQLQGASESGGRAFFVTQEQLTGEDFNPSQDIYMHSASGTVLVSQGNGAGVESQLAPPTPILERTNPESPGVSTQPKVIGHESTPEATIKLYSTPDCSGEPVTGSTEQLADPGIPVTVAVGSTTDFRATAEAEGFVSSCSASIQYSQASEPSPPAEGPGGVGTGGGGAVTAPAPAAPAPPVAKTPKGVAYVAPSTRITFGPAFKTRAPRPVFRFTDSTGQPGTRFLCRLDRGGWKPCGSPFKLQAVSRGKHVFQVKGINAVGVAEDDSAKRSFKVVSR
jgi:hypothetical protein